MRFRKKRIRKKENERLLYYLKHLKAERERHHSFLAHSVDPTPDVMAQVKIIEAKYMFLLREARRRNKNKQ
ncbi:YaaL family protein [Salsuginibacillus kocurii]|uniref:YaaL family protein n=1 Tax=Salsuginibacillus kocurii TaxID=427078 RepID=UPI000368134C|nr:YaaL family protein [Salsuginibacillus kocurii]